MKTILFFQTGTPEIARSKFAGVMSYAQGRDWDVKMVERGAGPPSLRKILAFWRPAGCIVEASGGARGLAPAAFGATPVVYQCHDPAAIHGQAACVTSDSAAVARLAAKELASLGMRHFAFVGWFGSVYWSDVKRDVFRGEVARQGGVCHVFAPAKDDAADDIRLQRRLRAWLAGLPRPCGVLAVSDVMGGQVLAACRAIGLRVPKDMAVLGVNNDEQLCEATIPPLSSVQLDYRRTGRLAAELLDRTMAGEAVTGHFTVPPGGIVRRASSRAFQRQDREARRAVDLIRRHACDGLRPQEVLATFNCSRRLAEMRFRAATGHSVTEEIQAVRLARVYTLLAQPDVPISVIAGRCGWTSESFLRRYFHRVTGLSLLAYRQRKVKGER